MAIYRKRNKRILLPAWQDYNSTIKNKELIEEGYNNNSPLIHFEFSSKENWLKEKNIGTALQLVNDVIISKKYSEGKEAAFFLLETKEKLTQPILKGIDIILNVNNDNNNNSKIVICNELSSIKSIVGKKINACRRSIKFNVRNPIAWAEISRLNLINGDHLEAEKAIIVALNLAPNNRYVLRAAISFYKWKDENKTITSGRGLEYTLQLLKKNPYTAFDPWLLNLDISLNSIFGKTSIYVKKGFEIVSSNNFSDKSLSELSSSLASLELHHGKIKKSKQLFEISLLDPLDNTLAQADWASEKISINLDYNKIISHEANCYHNLRSEKYKDAYEEAVQWFINQPMKIESCILGSYIAGSLLDDNIRAVELCNYGLVSSPESFTLLNNKAYFLSVEGNVKEAINTFKKIDYSSIGNIDKIVSQATFGMIFFRSGDFENGSFFYDKARCMAEQISEPKLASLISIYKTRAEFLVGANKTTADEAIRKLEVEVNKYDNVELNKTLANVKRHLLGKLITPFSSSHVARLL